MPRLNPPEREDRLSSERRGPAAKRQPDPVREVVRVERVSKSYGPTQALDGAEVAVGAGEVVAVVGHNGAGKSTLMRVLCGLTSPDEGRILLADEDVTGSYSLVKARAAGIRIVFQELSLCSVLRAYENVLVAHPQLPRRGWRRRAAAAIQRQLDEIFPGHGISPRATVANLTLAQRQMLEIARAAAPIGEEVRMLILDEPTSALGARAASQLFDWLARQSDHGMSAILISHRLREVLEHSDRTVVMRDGRVVGDCPSSSLSRETIVEMMGQAHSATAENSTRRSSGDRHAERPRVLEIHGLTHGPLHDIELNIGEGEVVGLAGLDGQGQRDLLFTAWNRRRRRRGVVRAHGRMAFVAGDRQESGLFRMWTLRRNVSVGALGAAQRFGVVSGRAERDLVRGWIKRLEIRGSLDDPVTGLSGGTQQKAVIARALATKARLVLLDDPFRGVDVGTKRQAYGMIHEEAANGRSFLWFTTENDELEECDRVYVFRAGRIVEELCGDEIREDRVIASSFAETRQGEMA